MTTSKSESRVSLSWKWAFEDPKKDAHNCKIKKGEISMESRISYRNLFTAEYNQSTISRTNDSPHSKGEIDDNAEKNPIKKL